MIKFHAKSTFTGMMAVILGFLSRPCCSIPFFLAIFGMGSGGLVELIEPYRHLFLGVSLLSFLMTGWMVFQVEGAIFNKIFFVLSVFITVLFLFPPQLILNL